MKTGVIIYVAGDRDNVGVPKDKASFLRDHGFNADRWEIITRSTGPADIHDAWWRLLTKGMQQVHCLMAEVDTNGEMRLTGRQMRLCG
jgi:hypothetical protein